MRIRKSLILSILFALLFISAQASTIVRLGPEYFPDPTRGKPISSGSLYIGEPDLDPEVVANQIQVSALQENGVTVSISQPISTGAGGVPLYNGSPVTLSVEETYSLKLLDSAGVQVYYVPENLDDGNIDAALIVDHKTDHTHIVYQSVAELRASTLTPFEDQKVSTTGSISEGDGGGGDWFWDASSTLTDNTGTVVKVTTITTGRWERIYSGAVNALWFGQPGDDIIQNAMDTGERELIIPDIGIDWIGDALDIPSSLRVLRGVGLPVLTTSAAGIHVIDTTGYSGDGLTITGINFTGHSGGSEATSNQLITIENMDFLYIYDNTFTNGFHRAINLRGVHYFSVSDNTFFECSNGPYFFGCENGNINRNNIRGSQQLDATFKIGIALQSFDATYGKNVNINVSNNIIRNLENGQAILGHGGTRIVVSGNNISDCAQGINFNSFVADDSIVDVVINGNQMSGLTGGEVYVPAADVGISIGGTGSTTGSVVVTNNSIRSFNLLEDNANLGGISIISIDDILIANNIVRGCKNNGIVFSGANSLNVTVTGNSIIDITGDADNGAIKIDSPTIVRGLIENNYLSGNERAFRVETVGLSDLIVNNSTEALNNEISTGLANVIYNGGTVAADGDTTPSVRLQASFIVLDNTAATDITDLDDSEVSQSVIIRDNNSTSTIKDASTGGSFQLAGGADFVFTSNDILTVISSSGIWYEVSRSLN